MILAFTVLFLFFTAGCLSITCSHDFTSPLEVYIGLLKGCQYPYVQARIKLRVLIQLPSPIFKKRKRWSTGFAPRSLGDSPTERVDRDDIWHGESNANTVRNATSCNPLEFAHNSLSIVKRYPRPVRVNELQFTREKSTFRKSR
ncbi:unnamed protein product [Hymenolepis diminuta]|uniref:Secreted protein n=1 Tax=Hymenolepis diminuta TaxID=6216 RepID=A0A564YWG1_HYMDI|nr:unnamed protein product [Hymenolepis diminuta]VUZ51350.1 unnamed protein product [Hymenolepis diminuta]VUZ54286.1 unnamed protein product [Hymenolepis diminuta]